MSEKILVAVADPSSRSSVMSALKNSGYGIYDIGEIVSAADAFSKVNPSLIVADTEFTDWFLSQFRQAASRDLPVICYLKEHNARLAYDYLKKGAYDCITDPLRPIEIVDIVNKSLSKDVLSFDKAAKQNIFDYIAALPLIKKIYMAAGTAAFIGIFWLSVYVAARPSVKSQMEVSHRNVTGVVVGAKSVYVSDWFTQSVYRYARERGELLDVYYFSDFGPLGLATDGASVYSVGTDSLIRRHVVNDAAKRLETAEEYPAPGLVSGGGIFAEKDFIWAGDTQMKKLFLYEIIRAAPPSSGALRKIGEYSTGAISPVAICKKGDKIFLADGVTGSVFSGRIIDDRFIPQKENAAPAGFRVVACAIEDSGFLAVFAGDTTFLKRTKFK